MRRAFMLLAWVLVAAVGVSLLGCAKQPQGAKPAETPVKPGEKASQEPAEKAAEQPADKAKAVRIVHASGPIGSGWYPISILFTDIWMDKIPGLNVTVIEGASVSNVRVVNEGKDATNGLTYFTDYIAGVKGEGPFAGKPCSNVQVVSRLYPGWWNIAVLDKSPVKKFEDLIGRHIFPGGKGFGSELGFQRILSVYGKSYDDITKAGGKISYGGYADGANMLKDGVVDCIIAIGSPEVPALQEVDALNPVRLIPLPEDKLKAIESKGWGYDISVPIPAGTYKNQKEPVPAISDYSVLIVNKSLSEDLVYKMTRTLWENIERVRKEQPRRGGWIRLETALKGVDLSLFHPGAVKYYKEIGLLQ